MTYTIAQFLAAAEAAEVSMIDAQHICDTLLKMNGETPTFRLMLFHDSPFKRGEVVKLIETDLSSYYPYLVQSKDGLTQWIRLDTSEPTTETF